MKFWDFSAIVPLIIAENNTDYCLELLSKDPEWSECMPVIFGRSVTVVIVGDDNLV
jgi:hypothetical protein